LVYRALTEYLRHRHRPRGAPPWAIRLPILLFGLSLFWPPTRRFAALLFLATLAAMIAIYVWHQNRRIARQAAAGRLETEAWIAQVGSYLNSGQLEERSHPTLLIDLEACADLRQRILNALNSEEWNRLCRQSGWSDVRTTCQETAESLLVDAIWSAKGAMRAPGGRRETFRRRCEDPNFAAKALGGVRLAREKLQTLLDEVHDDPFAAQGVRGSLERAQAEMAAIRAAETELREYVGGMIAEDLE